MSSAFAELATVLHAYGDRYGAVHVIYSDHKEKIVKNLRSASGVEDIRVASDAQTVGWLVDWTEESSGWRTIPGALVIWRDGKVVRKFAPGPTVFWGWTFWKEAEQVAYELGPMHFSNGNFELRDVATGRLIAHCYYNDYDETGSDPGKMPDWAKAVRDSEMSKRAKQ